jgi:hypothetical protein
MACAPCPALSVPVTDPLEILQRLPEALFDFRPPFAGDPGATFDEIFFDETIFGPLDPTEPTPQYEFARIIAAERDHFVLEWRRSVSLQLGLGHMEAEDGSHQCPHAEGEDLDRVAEQYGVPRPMGFTDCCYWKLVLLVLFKPGTTRWLISEICELYTGHRPALYEEPAKLIIGWPTGGGVSFLDDRTDDADPGGWFIGVDAYVEGDAMIAGDDEMYHGYVQAGPEEAGDRRTFIGDGPDGAGLGLTLDQAIGRVKAAGVAVSHIDRAPDGRGGCFGETRRGLIDGFVIA